MKKYITTQDVDFVDKAILDNYEQHKTDETWIVQDGIIDLDSYNEAKHRILWVLKEVNEVSDGDGVVDWDMRDFLKTSFREGNKIKKGWANTFEPIILCSYGILNNSLWNDMDYLKDNPDMIDVIKSIAYINLKKQPGGSVADPNEVKKHYLRDEAVILYQIEKFNPDIIICGGTLNDYLIKGLDLREENSEKVDDVTCYLQDGKIYIRTYHPGAYVNKITYVDGIINAVRFWETKK